MSRTFYNTLNRIHKLFLLTSKNTPPYKFWSLAIGIRRKAMKCTFHEVKRQQTIFTLYVLNYLTPMFMIVQFLTQNLKAETKMPFFVPYYIINKNLTLTYVIIIINESSKNIPTKTEIVIILLKNTAELCRFNIRLKFNPNRIIRIVKENSWRNSTIFYYQFASVFIKSDNTLNTI